MKNMDFSSLPEEQQKQLQKLQQLFQEHQQQQQQRQIQQLQQQQQQQQQQVQEYSALYDPTSSSSSSSQVHQPYDYSSYYAAYYQQQPQYQQDHPQSYSQTQPQQQQQQQHLNPNYVYHRPDYVNAYPQQRENGSQHQPEPALNYPSGHCHGSHSQFSSESGRNYQQGLEHYGNHVPDQVQGQQNEYDPQQQGEGGIRDQRDLAYQGPPGLTPAAAAAVAALSQLAQFAGNMEATEKAMAMQAQGGLGGAFMDQGQLNQGPAAQFGGPVARPAYLGNGRRGGRPFRGRGPGNFGNHPLGPGFGGIPFHGRGHVQGRPSFGHTKPNGPPSSLHPNPSSNEAAEPTGHDLRKLKTGVTAPSKPLPQVFWCELCKVDCTSLDILEQHKNGKKHRKNLDRAKQLPPVSISESQHKGKSVAEEALQENTTAESVDLENKNDKPTVTEKNSGDPTRGTKRKMRSGQGGKSSRWATEPAKPKLVIPLICDLCNVKCDTQEVFDKHLGGKKHISKVKQYEGHQRMYGPVGLQALYPPNPMSQTLGHPQGPQEAYPVPQGPYLQPEPYMPELDHKAPSATGEGHGVQQHPNYPMPGPI